MCIRDRDPAAAEVETQFVDRVVEVPQVQLVERTVEVPEIRCSLAVVISSSLSSSVVYVLSLGIASGIDIGDRTIERLVEVPRLEVQELPCHQSGMNTQFEAMTLLQIPFS
eukprot:6467551-Amphidinium_carterae.2